MNESLEANLNDTTRDRDSHVFDSSVESIEPKNWGQLYQKDCLVIALFIIYHLCTHFMLPYKIV
jgi:hypothetical protein